MFCVGLLAILRIWIIMKNPPNKQINPRIIIVDLGFSVIQQINKIEGELILEIYNLYPTLVDLPHTDCASNPYLSAWINPFSDSGFPAPLCLL